MIILKHTPFLTKTHTFLFFKTNTKILHHFFNFNTFSNKKKLLKNTKTLTNSY